MHVPEPEREIGGTGKGVPTIRSDRQRTDMGFMPAGDGAPCQPSRSHSLMVRSDEPETTDLLSGVSAMLLTRSSWPASVERHAPAWGSQSLSVPSRDPVTTSRESSVTATELIQSLCPGRSQRRRADARSQIFRFPSAAPTSARLPSAVTVMAVGQSPSASRWINCPRLRSKNITVRSDEQDSPNWRPGTMATAVTASACPGRREINVPVARSQTCRVPSSAPESTVCESDANARPLTQSSWPV